MAGGRIPPPSDFRRALASRPCARTEHFVLHHLSAPADPMAAELSTGAGSPAGDRVDGAWHFGQVLPKRHARRAVTRNLIRRQGRAGFERHRSRLAAGEWLLRLRTPFDPSIYPSAASTALRRAVRAEIDALFQAVRR
ncbi:MAG TPA: ribonuclease P protein component [Methylibium sp.]|nr:ribonuclease P protein component [Methylibium sp.]